jgi:putative PIN family toxin of toxin-antitoxin system
MEAEISEVLNRASIRSKFPQITDELVKDTLADLVDAKRIVVEVVEPISRDPKDDIFLACAKAANADYLVSEDQDLLVLKEYGGAKIVSAITFLDILKGSQEEQND